MIGNGGSTTMDAETEVELQAAAFRALIDHLQRRTDVQNIDLMNLAGFCRNCLANWFKVAASERGLALTEADVRARIYGMPYDQWKARYQTPATPEQLAARAALHGH
jgi:hypothetical protein